MKTQASFYPLLDRAIAHITSTTPPESFPEHLRIIMYGESFRLQEGVATCFRAENAVLRWLLAEMLGRLTPPNEKPNAAAVARALVGSIPHG